jgi:hypothetical protein
LDTGLETNLTLAQIEFEISDVQSVVCPVQEESHLTPDTLWYGRAHDGVEQEMVRGIQSYSQAIPLSVVTPEGSLQHRV